MAILDDVLKLTLFQNIRGSVMMNVFFYRVTTAGVTALDVATSFDIGVLPDIAGIQVNDVNYDLLDVVNLFDPTDFASLVPTTTTGLGTGADLGLFPAVSFKFPTSDKSIRSGSKRFGGVPSAVQTDGIITNAPHITAMNSLGAALISDLAAGTGVITPVVVKRIREGADPGPYTYRLPENQIELSDYTIDVVTPDLEITSQNSRKSGVGI